MHAVAIACLIAGATLGGPPAEPAPNAPNEELAVPNSAEAEVEAADEDLWEFSASLYGYAVRDGRDYLALTLIADRDWLHLEGRFNYENFDTGALFIGYNWSVGETVTLDLTPMIGGVIGDADAIAPGYEITLGYKWLELYTEGEYLFDLNTSDDNYFYSWSELTVSPADWIWGGLAAQRTKLRDEDSEIALGPMLGFAYKAVELSLYLFQPGQDDQTFATAFTVNF